MPRASVPAVAQAAVKDGVVADADLADAGLIFGTGFAPHRGGPIAALRARGKPELLAIMAELRKKHGERFTPDAGWETI